VKEGKRYHNSGVSIISPILAYRQKKRKILLSAQEERKGKKKRAPRLGGFPFKRRFVGKKKGGGKLSADLVPRREGKREWGESAGKNQEPPFFFHPHLEGKGGVGSLPSLSPPRLPEEKKKETGSGILYHLFSALLHVGGKERKRAFRPGEHNSNPWARGITYVNRKEEKKKGGERKAMGRIIARITEGGRGKRAYTSIYTNKGNRRTGRKNRPQVNCSKGGKKVVYFARGKRKGKGHWTYGVPKIASGGKEKEVRLLPT